MWLEVSEDLSIVVKSVVAVEAVDQMNSIVYTDGRTFKVPMPKGVIMSMIATRSKGVDSMTNVERLLTDLYKTQSTPRP